jgi:hypothetical protein
MTFAAKLVLLALAAAAAPGGALGFWSSGGSNNKEDEKKVADNHAQALTEWFRKSESSFLSASVELRRKSSDDPRLGVFVTSPIAEGDMIMSVPNSLHLTPTPPQVGDKVEANGVDGEDSAGVVTEIKESDGTYTIEDENGDLVHDIPLANIRHADLGVSCGTVRRVLQELKFGKSSVFAPYIEFMAHTASAGSIPAAWSSQGKALLHEILGKAEDGLESLPPISWSTMFEEHWVEACGGNKNDVLEASALAMTMRRAWGDQLVPVFDVIGHRNGEHTNAHHTPIEHGPEEGVRVYASRDLEPGEEVLITYNFCEECRNRRLEYGTPELFRDYGFVEHLPQRWVFFFKNHDPIVFDLEEQNENDKKKHLVRWSGQYRLPTEPADVEFFTHEAARLEALGKSPALVKNDRKVPDHEYRTIVQYHQALLTALKVGVESIKEGVSKGEFELMDTEEQLEQEEAALREEEEGEEFEDEEFFDEEEEEEL